MHYIYIYRKEKRMNEYFNLLGKCHHSILSLKRKKKTTREREREKHQNNNNTYCIRIIESMYVLHQSDSFDCLMMLVTLYKSFDESINAYTHTRFVYMNNITIKTQYPLRILKLNLILY